MASHIQEGPGLRLHFHLPQFLLGSHQPHSIDPLQKAHLSTHQAEFLLNLASALLHQECASLHGTLQHLSFVFQDGHSFLASLSAFITKFPNNFVQHHSPTTLLHDIHWWRCTLAHNATPHSLAPHPFIDPCLFVDASTSFGIGIIMGKHWAAWKLSDGWRLNNRDIGWVETITMELAMLLLVNVGFNSSIIVIHSDNTGVIGTYNSGHLHNPEQNSSLQHTMCTLACSGLTISPLYMPSSSNLANAPSCGHFSLPVTHLLCNFTLPHPLSHWLSPIS